MSLRTVMATRYVTPLREGGSLPAVVEADDDGLYVSSSAGQGRGPKRSSLLLAGEIARAAGLSVPELVFVELGPELARTEPDPEIQPCSGRAPVSILPSTMPGAMTFDPVAEARRSSCLCSRVVRRVRDQRRLLTQYEPADMAPTTLAHRSWCSPLPRSLVVLQLERFRALSWG